MELWILEMSWADSDRGWLMDCSVEFCDGLGMES